MSAEPRIWAVLPAAGVGRRMGGSVPKQYLPVAGRTVIGWSLAAVAGHPRVAGAVVALAVGDGSWEPPAAAAGHPVYRVDGGAERADSVRAALRMLRDGPAGPEDWALVHDAVRPCVSEQAVSDLVAAVFPAQHSGGLLAIPVRDTLKRADADGQVASTADRDGLWQAQTPQLFPLRALLDALDAASARGESVTDEAQAMEQAGHRPRLVTGEATNLKITRPEDLTVAAGILGAARAGSATEQVR